MTFYDCLHDVKFLSLSFQVIVLVTVWHRPLSEQPEFFEKAPIWCPFLVDFVVFFSMEFGHFNVGNHM